MLKIGARARESLERYCMKYHINSRGDVKPCSAAKGKCPFGGQENHYLNKALALKAVEDKYEAFSIVPDTQSSVISYIYTQYCIENKRLHNSINIGDPAELFYYSSAQGRLELERRLSYRKDDKRYHFHFRFIKKIQVLETLFLK